MEKRLVFVWCCLLCSVVAFERTSVGLDTQTGFLGCFGDFDNDKSADVVVVSGSNLLVRPWRCENGCGFQQGPTIIVPGLASGIVHGVVAFDLNLDGRLDLLVTVQQGASFSVLVSLQLDTLQFAAPTLVLDGLGDQPMVADVNGDGTPDLLGSTMSGQRTAWVGTGSSTVTYTRTELPSGTTSAFTTPSANSFVDVNGDCVADLVLVSSSAANSTTFEFWLNSGEGSAVSRFGVRAEPAYTVTTPGIGLPLWADMDGDGNVDLVLPVCGPSGCAVVVVYNMQRGMCDSPWISSGDCRGQQALCTSAPFEFDLNGDILADSPNRLVFPVSGGLWTSPDLRFPLSLSAGDADLDGSPDMLVATSSASSNNNGVLELWLNVGCAVGPNCPRGHTFERISLPNIAAPAAAAFLDFGEDGTPDILAFSANAPASPESTFSISALASTTTPDSYSLKILGANSVCPERCPDDYLHAQKPYGAAQPGATFKFTVTSLAGTKHARFVAQSSRTTHTALASPSTLVGLGRTSNYIEEFFYGVPSNSSVSQHMWICIIPNSHLYAFPFPADSPSNWVLELEMNFQDKLFTVFIYTGVLAATMGIIGIVILVLQLREKSVDHEEKLAKAHLFNFEAM